MLHRAIYPVVAVQRDHMETIMLLTNVSQANFDMMCATLVARHDTQVTKKPQGSPPLPGQISGEIKTHGALINYVYNPKDQTLAGDIVHHPFWVRAAQIENGLRDAMIPAEAGSSKGKTKGA